MSVKPILEIKELQHIYMENTPMEQQALSGVNMTIYEGECAAIIGHTGSGKSTLIQHFNGLLRPQKGKVIIEGVDLSEPKIDIKMLRRKVGLVFQNPEDQLFEQLIGDDIAYGPLKMGLPIEEVRQRVKWAMELVGLSFEELKDRVTYALSGGQKRKAALAGVLALKPKVLVLDEPTAGLDPRSRLELLSQIQALNKKENLTVIFVSHNMSEVAYLADKVFVMAEGKTVLQGSPKDIFSKQETLEEYNIGTPETVEILSGLKKSGFSVNLSAFEVKEAADEIIKVLQTSGRGE